MTPEAPRSGDIVRIDPTEDGYPPLLLVSTDRLRTSTIEAMREAARRAFAERLPLMIETHHLDVFQLIDGEWKPIRPFHCRNCAVEIQ